MKKIILILLLTFVAVPARALQIDELLSLVAMPLAVAAVAEIADVPSQPLFDLVALLNDAAVPPPQFIEVIRYVPVALVVVDNDPRDFVQFVRLRTEEGLRQEAFLRAIETELRLYGVPDVQLFVSAPRVVEVRQDFVPAIVLTRMVERKGHPHGGPPGQLKKAAGVKTGAEIVHGSRPGREVDKAKVKKDRDVPAVVVDLDRGDKGRDGGGKKKEGEGSGRGEKGDHGGGKGKGKGKG